MPPPDVSPELRTYRVVCLLAAAFIPAFGYAYHGVDPGVVDPLWMRWALGALPLVLAGGTYVSPWVRTHLERLGAALVYAFVAWFAVLTALNGLAPEYGAGYVFVVVMIGVATPDMTSLRAGASLRTITGCLLFAVAAGGAVVLAVPDPGMDPWIFWLCVAATAVTIFTGIRLRLAMRVRLQASEVRYRAVFDSVADGLFLTDARSHRFLHANEAYLALTGYSLAELRALTLHDVAVAPPGFVEEKARELMEDARISIGEQQHRCRDGSLIDLEIGVNAVEQDGRAVFCTTARDLTAQKRARAEVQAARERAEEMLRLKSALLDTMSHELRTPLVSVLGFAELLSEEVTDEQHALVEVLLHNAHRLSDTLGALLDLAQLRGGEADLEVEVVDVGEVVGEVAGLFRPRVEAKQLSFQVETSEAARAQLDREALHRLLSHLLSNALKFTDCGGITLAVEADLGRVLIRVRDTGIGMDAEAIPSLFDAFEQASTGIRRRHEGAGLGLAITKHLVELMDGRIEVDSVPGVGTTVTVSFARMRGSSEETLVRRRADCTAGSSAA